MKPNVEMTADFHARVAAIAAPLPAVTADESWGGGYPAWRIGGRMFAVIGAEMPGVAVRCADAEMAAMLVAAGVAARTPVLPRNWVQLPEAVDDGELQHRIAASYRLVRAALPVALRKSLPEPVEA